MKALVSPNEPVLAGFRVAEIAAAEFEVASPMFWIECPDDVKADEFWYDPVTLTLKSVAPEVAAPTGSA